MKARQKRRKCPKCGKYYIGYPALPRKDNKAEICSRRRVFEALIVYIKEEFSQK